MVQDLGSLPCVQLLFALVATVSQENLSSGHSPKTLKEWRGVGSCCSTEGRAL